MERTCKVCGQTKPITAFGKTKSAGNGEKYYRWECRSCTYKRQNEWRLRNKDKIRKKSTDNMRKWRDRKMKENPAEFRKIEAKKAKLYRTNLKEEVYAAYGGYRCACCDETEPSFLSIDHINNDGYQLRKLWQGSGANIYNWLKREFKKTGKWPSDFQILCMNCQHGKARNNGICPHKKSVTTSRKA